MSLAYAPFTVCVVRVACLAAVAYVAHAAHLVYFVGLPSFKIEDPPTKLGTPRAPNVTTPRPQPRRNQAQAEGLHQISRGPKSPGQYSDEAP